MPLSRQLDMVSGVYLLKGESDLGFAFARLHSVYHRLQIPLVMPMLRVGTGMLEAFLNVYAPPSALNPPYTRVGTTEAVFLHVLAPLPIADCCSLFLGVC